MLILFYSILLYPSYLIIPSQNDCVYKMWQRGFTKQSSLTIFLCKQNFLAGKTCAIISKLVPSSLKRQRVRAHNQAVALRASQACSGKDLVNTITTIIITLEQSLANWDLSSRATFLPQTTTIFIDSRMRSCSRSCKHRLRRLALRS